MALALRLGGRWSWEGREEMGGGYKMSQKLAPGGLQKGVCSSRTFSNIFVSSDRDDTNIAPEFVDPLRRFQAE